MAKKLTTDELLEAFKEMTLIELSEFVKLFEDTFGVTAAAPVAVAAAAAPAAEAAEAEEESNEVDVILDSVGDKKIQVIKEVRSLTNLGPGRGQGPGRGCAEGRAGEGHPRSCCQGQGGPRGRRRRSQRQVTLC